MAEGKMVEEKIVVGDKVISDKKDEKGLKDEQPAPKNVQDLIEQMKQAEMKQAMPPLSRKEKRKAIKEYKEYKKKKRKEK